jgi:chromosome segregation ATPase
VPDAIDDAEAEARIDALYQRPLADFVAARNALAKELRPHDRARSDEVKALRKPTVAAWALDRAASRDPDAVAELRAAGAAVQEAQESALAGDRGALREATERRRNAIARLTDAAASDAGDAHRDEIAATLEAASVDDELHAQLAAGRLTATTEARAGFGDLAGLLAASADAPAGDELAARRRRAEADRLRARMADAETAVEDATGDVRQAEERLARAEEALATARQHLSDATQVRDELASQLEELGPAD